MAREGASMGMLTGPATIPRSGWGSSEPIFLDLRVVPASGSWCFSRLGGRQWPAARPCCLYAWPGDGGLRHRLLCLLSHRPLLLPLSGASWQELVSPGCQPGPGPDGGLGLCRSQPSGERWGRKHGSGSASLSLSRVTFGGGPGGTLSCRLWAHVQAGVAPEDTCPSPPALHVCHRGGGGGAEQEAEVL